MTEALVTPDVLTWARLRRGLEVGELASRLNVKPEAINAWEDGAKRPTFRQAQLFAQAVYVPFGYLYLPEPPIEELPLPDFRIIPGQNSKEPSADFLDLLNDVLGKQEWYRQYRESQGVEELSFVGRFGTTDPEDVVASDIREVIDVDAARRQASDREGFMRELSRNAEKSGIMVMRSGVVGNNNHRLLDVDEFRGFSISDHIAPLIFINGRDFKGAQIFTLAHELAHIWSGQGGISNPDYGLSREREDSTVEQFCNRVAAETLVPREDFRSRWALDSPTWEDNLNSLSSHYKVSPMVILRKAHDEAFLPIDEFRGAYSRLVEQAGKAQQTGSSGGDFRNTVTARNGAEFTGAVISRAAEGSLLSSEAADLLGVKVKTLPSIAEHIFGDPLSLD